MRVTKTKELALKNERDKLKIQTRQKRMQKVSMSPLPSPKNSRIAKMIEKATSSRRSLFPVNDENKDPNAPTLDSNSFPKMKETEAAPLDAQEIRSRIRQPLSASPQFPQIAPEFKIDPQFMYADMQNVQKPVAPKAVRRLSLSEIDHAYAIPAVKSNITDSNKRTQTSAQKVKKEAQGDEKEPKSSKANARKLMEPKPENQTTKKERAGPIGRSSLLPKKKKVTFGPVEWIAGRSFGSFDLILEKLDGAHRAIAEKHVKLTRAERRLMIEKLHAMELTLFDTN